MCRGVLKSKFLDWHFNGILAMFSVIDKIYIWDARAARPYTDNLNNYTLDNRIVKCLIVWTIEHYIQVTYFTLAYILIFLHRLCENKLLCKGL